MGNSSPQTPPIEFRKASVGGVNFEERLIEVIAVPYEQRAAVFYRGEMWEEEFLRGSFDGIESRSGQIRVNREHRIGDTVGKINTFVPEFSDGLKTIVRVAATPRGDETLVLADEEMISASVGFGVRGSDQILDKRNKVRQIKRAFLDHLAFVEQPAYTGAKILSVRDADDQRAVADDLEPLAATPDLDDLTAWMTNRKR